MGSDLPYVMRPREIALGIPLGHDGHFSCADGPVLGARAALEQVIRAAVARPPCGVAFSGGRDSSLVLAVATHVARRDGFPDPIPLTKRFPELPETDEGKWQENVIRHLGLREWNRVDLHDELDLLGSVAQEHLRVHGVVWPPMVHGKRPLFGPVRGGSLLDGEGGDEVLGVESHRIAALYPFIRSRGRRGRRAALLALAPARVRHRMEAGDEMIPDLPWLQPELRHELTEVAYWADLRRPLPFGRSVRLHATIRAWKLAEQSRRALAAPHDVEVVSPLMAPEFIDAMARERWLLGFGSRTDAMRALASDLLSPPILERTSKASFGDAYWGSDSRAFIAQWDGGGLDREMIDTAALKEVWMREDSHAMTAALLQEAWLATQSG